MKEMKYYLRLTRNNEVLYVDFFHTAEDAYVWRNFHKKDLREGESLDVIKSDTYLQLTRNIK